MDLSEALGAASCACWVLVQAPQAWTNFQRGSVDGLSLAFLVIWIAGDSASLVGCLLLNQLPFQVRGSPVAKSERADPSRVLVHRSGLGIACAIRLLLASAARSASAFSRVEPCAPGEPSNCPRSE